MVLGKSTLAATIMGNEDYKVISGNIEYKCEDLLKYKTFERARKGIFLSFQNPVEIPGITVTEFLRSAKQAIEGKEIGILDFTIQLQTEMRKLNIPSDYAMRYFNEGFSGGERKKMEILQMNILNPELIMLDETDSGLDIDATELISKNIKANIKSSKKTYIIITHHKEILKYIPVDYVHVLKNGRIIKTGGKELITKIEKEGFENIKNE